MGVISRVPLCRTAAIAAVSAMLWIFFPAEAAAGGIGLIDTTEILEVRAEANDTSEIVGQLPDETPVAILQREEGWIQIVAGTVIGWVPEENLIEAEGTEAEEAATQPETETTPEALETEEGTQEVFSEEETEIQQEPAEDAEVQAESTAEDAEVQAESAAEAAGVQEESAAEDVDVQGETPVQEQIEAQLETEQQTEPDEAQAAALQAQIEAEQAAALQAQIEVEQAAALQAQMEAEQAAALQAQVEVEQAAALQAQIEAEQAAALQAQIEAEQAAALQAQYRAAALAAAGATEEDLYLMANIIFCEAGGEPYLGKVAVGSVIMNRVYSDSQPDSIHDVVYARGQFSPVRNGSLARALERGSADETCYQAALEAFLGAKPVGDKLYFRRRNGRSGQVIGGHVFY